MFLLNTCKFINLFKRPVSVNFVSQINPLLSYLTLNIIIPDRDSSVGMATSYVLDGPGI
jgi:hypothetical protein